MQRIANPFRSVRLRYAPPLLALLFAALLAAASFLLQGNVGLNLADEGFLWHGAMRVLRGDIPLRDFQSYDPGRYYWSAAWMRVSGSDGILALRLAVAVFQACGLAAALVLLRRVLPGRTALLLAGFALLLWYFPRHKSFDLSLSIFAVCAGAALIARPSPARHFAAGVYVGLAAFFGRNHGVYAALAIFALALLALARIDRSRAPAKLALLAAGTLAGYSPMLLLAATQPGFLQAMVDSVLLMFRLGATNLALPVPWPWNLPPGLPLSWSLHLLVVGCLFVAVPLFYAGVLLAIARAPRGEALARNSVPVAASVVGLVYLHYAFARADAGHLAHAILPFLIAVLAVPAAWPASRPWLRNAVPVLVLLVTLPAAGLVNPWFRVMESGSPVRVDLRGDTLVIDADTARAVQAVQAIASEHLRAGEQIVFAPYWPTFYGALGRASPVWETYAMSGDAALQERFVRELDAQRVRWLVIGDAPLDGRDELRFSRLRPSVWRYLETHYRRVDGAGLPPYHQLLRRIDAQ